MLSTAEAKRAILAAMPQLDSETVSLDDAIGRVLRQNVVTERDQPPFDRVTMDGIAIRFSAFDEGRREFSIAGTQHAGDPVSSLDDGAGCIEVMTGTTKPTGADTVIAVERIQVADGVATIEDGYAPDAGQFIHRQASDHTTGTQVLTEGRVISPMDVAIIASCGLDAVSVSRLPDIRVISTGNELVPPAAPIEPHQIRLSNGPALVAMLASQGFTNTEHDHILDDPKDLERRIGEHLDAADTLVLSGGVSMGKADFVPKVLADLGVKVEFHRIAQRPGKPMWFGLGAKGQTVFALPGNPVSTLVCCRQYVLPALFHASGREERAPQMVVLDSDVEFKPNLTYFLPARISSNDSGQAVAMPNPTNTSGDFMALTGTDGYLELDAGTTSFPTGTIVPFHAWARP